MGKDVPKKEIGLKLEIISNPDKMDPLSSKIIALGLVLDEFRRVNPNMPVAQIQAFLMVALDMGMGMTDISDATGIKNSTTSRYLLELGSCRVAGDGALALIERGVDPQNTRKARYTLTKRGKELVRQINTILGGIENEHLRG